MDADRFDSLVRTLGSTTRRRALPLLAGGALGSLWALLRREDASAACRGVGKPCTRSGQCCTGARCKGGRCKCKAIHFKCGTSCCLDGASCVSLLGALVCLPGIKQPGDQCDPDQPGECASGVCGAGMPGSAPFCRVADCQATQHLCDAHEDCCTGGCWEASAECGSSTRCCRWPGDACQKDCDCCAFTDRVCRQGRCCVREFGGCASTSTAAATWSATKWSASSRSQRRLHREQRPRAGAQGRCLLVIEGRLGAAALSAASNSERPDSDLMSPVKTLRVPGPLRHQPHQTPGECFLAASVRRSPAPPESAVSRPSRHGRRPKSTSRGGWRSRAAEHPAARGVRA